MYEIVRKILNPQKYSNEQQFCVQYSPVKLILEGDNFWWWCFLGSRLPKKEIDTQSLLLSKMAPGSLGVALLITLSLITWLHEYVSESAGVDVL